MTKNLMACLALSGSLLAYGCATNSGNAPPNFSTMVSIAQIGLTTADAGLQSYCATSKHLPFCNDARIMAEITASYNAAQDSLTSVNTLLNSQGTTTQAQIQAAVDAFIKAVNDYTQVVDSFKHGKKPGTMPHMTRAEMLDHIQSLTDQTRSEMKNTI